MTKFEILTDIVKQLDLMFNESALNIHGPFAPHIPFGERQFYIASSVLSLADHMFPFAGNTRHENKAVSKVIFYSLTR